jgi:hypothetical protein
VNTNLHILTDMVDRSTYKARMCLHKKRPFTNQPSILWLRVDLTGRNFIRFHFFYSDMTDDQDPSKQNTRLSLFKKNGEFSRKILKRGKNLFLFFVHHRKSSTHYELADNTKQFSKVRQKTQETYTETTVSLVQ